MFRNARKLSLYKKLELQTGVFRKPSGYKVATKRHFSHDGTSKKRGVGIGLPVGILVTGTMASTILYAKFDPEFRDWLDKQVPGSSEIIKILCQEDDIPLSQRTLDLISGIQNWVYNLFSSNDSSLPPEEDKVAPVKKDEVAPYTAPEPVLAALLKNVPYPVPHHFGAPHTPWQEYHILESQDALKTIALVDNPKKPKEKSELPKSEAEPVTPQRLIDLEKEITRSTTIAVDYYNRAANATKDQAQYVQQLVVSDFSRLPSDLWSNIKEKTKLREDLVKTADRSAHVAEEKMLELENLLAKHEFEAQNSVLEQAQQNIKRMRDDISNACRKAEDETFNTNVTGELWPRVEEARQHWQDELRTLFPDVDLKEKNLNILADEIRQFILYSIFNVQYYQKEAANLELNAEKKLQEAIERATVSGDSRDLVTAAVKQELENERRRLELQYQKKSLEFKSACEQEIRKQLRLQTEIQADHLRDSIKLREIELEKMHRRELNKVITEENTKHQLQLAALVGRLKGIDDGLKAHAQIDKSAQQAQDLWTSCQILYRNIDPHSEHPLIRPLASAVNAVKKTSEESDELVNLVVKGIPQEALSRGVYSIKVLRERFLKVEKVARILAVVPEGGSSLPMYFLSWIQGCLIWKGTKKITPAELEDAPTAHELLNNYDLLSRARYWVDRGDLLQALRYMNLLSGASKSISEDWINEVRIYLECHQAATVLLNHASAKGFMYS